MKRVLSIFIAIILAVSICGCSSAENTSSESEPSEGYKRDGYEYADFEKFNSYASDNGLADTKVFIKGTVKSVFNFSDYCVLSVVSEDKGRWACSYINLEYSETIDEIFDEQEIVCFGEYRGFSDVFLMPSISIDKIELNDKIYTAENLKRLQEPTTEAEITTEQPTTKKATEPATEKPTENTDKVIFNNMGVKITYTGIETNWYGKEIKLLIENNSGHDYEFQVRDVSVNGYMIEPMFSCDVKNGKKANDSLRFSDDDLSDNGIEDIEKIELSIHAFNWGDHSNDFDSEMITFEP